MSRKARDRRSKNNANNAVPSDQASKISTSKLRTVTSALVQGSKQLASSLCGCTPTFTVLEDAPESVIRADPLRSHDLQAGANAKASIPHARLPESNDDWAAAELAASSRAGSLSESVLKGSSDKNKMGGSWLSAAATHLGVEASVHTVSFDPSPVTASGTPVAISSTHIGDGQDQLFQAVPSAKHLKFDGASLADMLRSLPAPACSSQPVRAPGSYAASLGSVLWVSDSESELQPASRLVSAVQSSHYSSIDFLADSRSSSISQGQLGYQRFSEAGDSAPDAPLAASAASPTARLQSDSHVRQEAIAAADSAAPSFTPQAQRVSFETAVQSMPAMLHLPSTASRQLRDSPGEAFASSTYLQLCKQDTPAHMEAISPAGTLSSQVAKPEHPLIRSITASSGAEGHQAGFAASKGSAPADLEFDCDGPVHSNYIGTAGLPAGGISWQLSELDVLLMKRQASLQKSHAARRLFLERPFSSSPTDRTSNDTNMDSPRLLANGVLEGWCYHTLASAQPMPRPQPAGVPTAATGAQQEFMAEHSCGSHASTTTESATGPQVTAASQSSNTSGKEELWCLRAHGGFTEKDSSAVAGQPVPAIKLLKIGSWGRQEGGRWGRLKENHIQIMAGSERSGTDGNQRKASVLRNISGPVLTTVGSVVSKISSTDCDKGGHAVKETGVAAVDDSVSGAGLLQGLALSSGGDRGVSVHAGRLARASSRLGSLFRRG